MPARRTVRIGLGIVALGIGLLAAGCFPSGPPAPGSLNATPSTLSFPTEPANGFMPQLPVTVTNTGGHPIDSISVPGVEIYSVPVNNCSTLAPGQSCIANFQFCPNTPGLDTQTTVITGRDTVTGAILHAPTITLTGTAT